MGCQRGAGKNPNSDAKLRKQHRDMRESHRPLHAAFLRQNQPSQIPSSFANLFSSLLHYRPIPRLSMPLTPIRRQPTELPVSRNITRNRFQKPRLRTLIPKTKPETKIFSRHPSRLLDRRVARRSEEGINFLQSQNTTAFVPKALGNGSGPRGRVDCKDGVRGGCMLAVLHDMATAEAESS